MSELLGLSADLSASPYLSFDDDPDESRPAEGRRNGWGVGWYPNGELGAAVMRDPRSGRSDGVTDVLVDWGMLSTPLLLAHVRGAAKRANYRDTHPFVTRFGGRSWMIAHDGDLAGDLSDALPIPEGPELEPIGPTDTEHLFMWLLGRMARAGASTIEGFGIPALVELLAEANELGTLNLLLADGSSLLAYRCASGSHPLYAARFVPPHRSEGGEGPAGLSLNGAGVTLGLGGHGDENRSLVVVSSVAFDDTFQPLAPGGHAVAEGGRIVASSADPDDPGPVRAQPGRRSLAPKADLRRLQIEHTTAYQYDEPIDRSSHRFRLHPVHDRFQQLFDHRIDISVDGVRYAYEDVFGNDVIGLDIDSPYSALVITMRAVVEVVTPFDEPHLLPRSQKLPVSWMPWQEHMMHSYLLPPELPESQLAELNDYARSFSIRNRDDLLETLDDIVWTIYRDYAYKPGFTTVETTPYEVFQARAGVCQDFANLMICLARMLGIPARYRVGYIYTGADYENTLQSDASHAWVEVYLPLIGWRGYDPTNGSRVGADHVRVAKGRNYRDATPTSGVIYRGGGGEESLVIDVQVNDVTPS